MMVGLKINFSKSEVIMINGDNDLGSIYVDIFNCQIGCFPTKYLGVPVSPSRLHLCDWSSLIDKTNKRLDIWKGGTMSIAGRSTLICTCLNNSPIYQMSVYLSPKTVTDKIDKVRRTFFWQGGGTKKKYHLVKWTKICKSKQKGGLGIKDLRKMNVSLLTKWWWKLEKEDGLWQEIVTAKYLQTKSIFSVSHKPSDSPIWYDLLKVKELYLQGRSIKIKNGKKCRFWSDPWLYDIPIRDVAPILFIISKQKEASVADVKSGKIQMTFTRWLHNDLQTEWDTIMKNTQDFQLLDTDDEIVWKFESNQRFTVKSMYNSLTKSESGYNFKKI